MSNFNNNKICPMQGEIVKAAERDKQERQQSKQIRLCGQIKLHV